MSGSRIGLMIAHRATGPSTDSTCRYVNGIRRICTLPSRSETNRSGMNTVPLVTTAPTGLAGVIAPPWTFKSGAAAFLPGDLGGRVEQVERELEQGPRRIVTALTGRRWKRPSRREAVSYSRPTSTSPEPARIGKRERPRPCRTT